MAKKRMSNLEIVLCGGLIVIGCIIILFAGISSAVSTEIDAICEEACAKYPGTKVEDLITYLEKTNDLKKKNKAIWALGELRDKKAIKKIKGEIPNPYFWK